MFNPLAFLFGLSRPLQLVLAAGGLMTALLVWDAWDDWQVAKRARAERDAEIKEINDAFKARAIAARDAALRCLDAGGVWRTATGTCVSPDPDG